jgi:hypothetical protein
MSCQRAEVQRVLVAATVSPCEELQQVSLVSDPDPQLLDTPAAKADVKDEARKPPDLTHFPSMNTFSKKVRYSPKELQNLLAVAGDHTVPEEKWMRACDLLGDYTHRPRRSRLRASVISLVLLLTSGVVCVVLLTNSDLPRQNEPASLPPAISVAPRFPQCKYRTRSLTLVRIWRRRSGASSEPGFHREATKVAKSSHFFKSEKMALS